MEKILNRESSFSSSQLCHLLICLIDCSGSMEGRILGSIKNMMEEISCDNDNNQIKILVGKIDTDLYWLNEAPVAIQEFAGWRKLDAGSVSNLGRAFSKFRDRLDQFEQYMNGDNIEEITILLFSDGMATDHYEEGMEQLKTSSLYQKARRYAVNPGEIFDQNVLVDFTGSKERIFDMTNMDALAVEKILLNIIYDR